MIRLGALAVSLLAGSLVHAQETGLQDRLRALSALQEAPPGPAPVEAYADEIASDLARIKAETPALFHDPRDALGTGSGAAAITLFIGPDCPDCARARAELATLAEAMDLRAHVIDVSKNAEDAALLARLTLDTLPSYVMPDKLIRGHMPAFVLERYLTE